MENTHSDTTPEAADLDRRREQVKRALRTDPDFTYVADVEDTDPNKRVLGVETENGAEFFIVIERP